MPPFLPGMIFLLLFALVVFVLFFVILPVSLVSNAFERLDLTAAQGLLVFAAMFLGRLVDIPVHRRGRLVRSSGVRMVGPFFVVTARPGSAGPGFELREQVLAVNLGGCVVPVLLALYLLSRHGWDLAQDLNVWLCVALVAAACFAFARHDFFAGLKVPFWVPPLATVISAQVMIHDGFTAAAASVAGSLGTLLGAGLFPLVWPGRMERLEAAVISVGGSGMFMGVFLACVLSVLLA